MMADTTAPNYSCITESSIITTLELTKLVFSDSRPLCLTIMQVMQIGGRFHVPHGTLKYDPRVVYHLDWPFNPFPKLHRQGS